MKIAIYSRKSKFTGKGESIENQITLCRDYISLHMPEVKENEISVYEDEGFSAKNLDRPQFKLMMSEESREKFDCIVVYRLDRISRNVGDFAGLIDRLNSCGTAFICIKEQFDTSTPMGRAMMNIAAVFAQLERETIAERVRDNLLMLARTGRWLGGNTPLGFQGEKLTVIDEGKQRIAFKLVPINEEIETVKLIFDKFLELQSMTKTVTYLIQHNVKTRRGIDFSCRAIKDILKNPVYCIADKNAFEYFTELGSIVCFDIDEIKGNQGLMPFRRTMNSGKQQVRTTANDWIIALGKHKGIIPSEMWLKAQTLIGTNAGRNFYRSTRNEVAVFAGLIRCENCGHIMRPRVNSNKRRNPDGTQTFSYMCEYKERSRLAKCQMCNINGNELDKLLCAEILMYVRLDYTTSKQLFQLEKQLYADDFPDNEKEPPLKRAIDSKKKMISNLMTALAKAEADSALFGYTNKQIELLDRELKQLEHQRQELLLTSVETDNVKTSLDLLVKSLSDFKETFEKSTVIEKRGFIKSIVDKVVWDGETAHIFLLGSKEDT